jgi:hypothetical protein
MFSSASPAADALAQEQSDQDTLEEDGRGKAIEAYQEDELDALFS